MSKLRRYLYSTEKSDNIIDFYDRVLEEWDIPLDENITALEASTWLLAQLGYNEEILRTSIIDVIDSEDWDAAVEFVWSCLKHGVMPHEFVNLLIKHQQVYNDLHS